MRVLPTGFVSYIVIGMRWLGEAYIDRRESGVEILS
jgi:hypothetical protein